MEPILLGEIVAAMVIACCINASVAVSFDLVTRDAACLVCHRRFDGEDNPWDMVASSWGGERALWSSPLNCKPYVRLRCPEQPFLAFFW